MPTILAITILVITAAGTLLATLATIAIWIKWTRSAFYARRQWRTSSRRYSYYSYQNYDAQTSWHLWFIPHVIIFGLMWMFLFMGAVHTISPPQAHAAPPTYQQLTQRINKLETQKTRLLKERRTARKQRNHYRKIAEASNMTPQRAIKLAFGRDYKRALRIARCESTTLDVRAKNGKYLGMFQVSPEWRRDQPGFGYTPIQQATHAYRIKVAAGWGPWECKG